MVLRLLFFAISALTCSAAVQIARTPVSGKIEWVYSYAEGQQLARKTGKPIFVVFRCER
jgi:hypothetical protein